MLKILIVDDSLDRVEIIKEYIERYEFKNLINVTYCETADKCRNALFEAYDLMVLDVVLPKKLLGVPQALHSFDLLKDIYSEKKKYIRPNMIIGLSADVTELGKYREFFFSNASIVLDGSLSNHDWIDSILIQVSAMLRTKQASMKVNSDKLLISIHGIRTYGQWQHELVKDLKKYSNTFDFIEMKYGFFDIFSFFVPFVRNSKANLIASRLKKIIEENPDKEVSIIAHSFGTIIVYQALLGYIPKNKIKKTILCGSPLPSKCNLSHIINSSELTINEAGTGDLVLVSAKLFIMGLGDAGRRGFEQDNTINFINRYHVGGHSLYFKKDGADYSFAEKKWLPLLISEGSPEHIDSRKNYLFEDCVELFLNLIERFKPWVYAFVIFIPFFSFLK